MKLANRRPNVLFILVVIAALVGGCMVNPEDYRQTSVVPVAPPPGPVIVVAPPPPPPPMPPMPPMPPPPPPGPIMIAPPVIVIP
jgi:hypothetical protein